MERRLRNESGFTFVEVMVSMVISGFVFAGIYGVYTIQQRSYMVQEQVSEMQQRLRAAVQFMAGEMRMAGYDPPNDYPEPNPYDDGTCDYMSILKEEVDVFSFEFCKLTSDQQDPPSYTAEKMTSTYTHRRNNDGSYDVVVNRVVDDDTPGITTVLAENIEAIEFLYLDKDETPVLDIDDTRTIKVSLLARSTFPDRKHTDTTVYEPASVRLGLSTDVWDINGADNPSNGTGNPPTSDPEGCDDADDPCRYHRRLLITTVKLRNMGLE